jgi:hypothetical protein
MDLLRPRPPPFARPDRLENLLRREAVTRLVFPSLLPREVPRVRVLLRDLRIQLLYVMVTPMSTA